MERFDFESRLIRGLFVLVMVVGLEAYYPPIWWFAAFVYMVVSINLFHHHMSQLLHRKKEMSPPEYQVRARHGLRASFLWPLLALWVVWRVALGQKK